MQAYSAPVRSRDLDALLSIIRQRCSASPAGLCTVADLVAHDWQCWPMDLSEALRSLWWLRRIHLGEALDGDLAIEVAGCCYPVGHVYLPTARN